MKEKKSLTIEYAKLTKVLNPDEYKVFMSFLERYIAYIDPSYVDQAMRFLNAEIDAHSFLTSIGKPPSAKLSEEAVITRACHIAARIIRASKTK